MSWEIDFLEDAVDDLRHLDGAVRVQVIKGIKRVSKNPLPTTENGYGKPLGSQDGGNLTNLLKIRFRNLDIRVVYKIERRDSVIRIIIISARANNQVYKDAAKRRGKCNL
ncbi:mRNA interferase RelE [uncultured Eubacterium sp.]|nr:mRNA interferase RelE [uncultured Eubacterium sp.]